MEPLLVLQRLLLLLLLPLGARLHLIFNQSSQPRETEIRRPSGAHGGNLGGGIRWVYLGCRRRRRCRRRRGRGRRRRRRPSPWVEWDDCSLGQLPAAAGERGFLLGRAVWFFLGRKPTADECAGLGWTKQKVRWAFEVRVGLHEPKYGIKFKSLTQTRTKFKFRSPTLRLLQCRRLYAVASFGDIR